MAASQPPSKGRPKTSVHRVDGELTLVGDETEDELPRDGIPWDCLDLSAPLPKQSSSTSRRPGTRVEVPGPGDEVVLIGDERSDQMGGGLVIVVLPD